MAIEEIKIEELDEDFFMSDKQEKQLINRTVRFSKLDLTKLPIYMGGNVKEKRGYFYGWDRDASKLYDKVCNALKYETNSLYTGKHQEVKDIIKAIVDDLIEITEHDVSHSRTKVVADVLSNVTKTIKTIMSEEKKLDPSKPILSTSFKDSITALKTYKEAIAQTKSSFLESDEAKIFGAETYAQMIYNNHLNTIDENDYALARAFAFIGSPLKFDRGRWEIDYEAAHSSQNGIKYQDAFGNDAIYRLPESNVSAFIDGYLNKSPSERNGKVITPSGLFRFYTESMVSNNSSLVKDDKPKIEAIINEAKLQFSTDNPVWQSYLIADEMSTRRDAVRLAMADVFMTANANISRDNIPDYSEELQQEIDGNSKVNATILDRLHENASKSHATTVASVISESNIEDIVQKYSKEHAELTKQLAVAGENKDIIQARLDEINKSYITVTVLRELGAAIASNVFKEYTTRRNENDLPDAYQFNQERIRELGNFFSDLQAMDFAQIVENDGKFQLVMDETKYPARYKEQISRAYESIKDKVSNLVGFQTIETPISETPSEEITEENNHEVVENTEEIPDEEIKLSSEDIYDLCWFAELGEDNEFNQVLADEAVFDRTCALLEGPDNLFKRTYTDFFNRDGSPSVDDLVEQFQADNGDGFDGFAFTADSIRRYRDGEAQKRANDELMKRYVIMDRMGKLMNSDPSILNAINEKSFGENKALIERLYQEAMQDYDKNPPTSEEIKSAKAKFDTINKKKNNDFIKSYSLKEGETPVSLIDALVKDPEMRKILLARESQIDNQYKQELGQDGQSQDDGRDADEESAEENKQEKEKKAPYTFKDKFGKNDGSATLKKLKPYCKKSCEKIIDDIIKMIDKTIIIPKEVVIENNEEPEIVEEPKTVVDPILEGGKGTQPKNTDPIEVVVPPEMSDEDKELASLKEEIEKRGKFAYLVSGRILNQSINDKNLEWKRENGAPNESELSSIKSLISVLDFIGGPDLNVADAKLKLALLDLIGARASSENADVKDIADKLSGMLEGIQNESLKEAIEEMVTTPDLIHFVWAMELSSELVSEDGKLNLGSKLDPQIIEAIKNNPENVDEILKEGKYFSPEVIQEASKIWADAVYHDKQKIDLGHILDEIEKKGEVPQADIDEAREMNSRVDEFFATKKDAEAEQDEAETEEQEESEPSEPEVVEESPTIAEESNMDELLAKYTATIITGAGGMSKKEFHAHHRVEYAKDLIREHKDAFTYEQAKDFIEKVRSQDISRAVIDYQFNEVLKRNMMEKSDDGMGM